MQKSALALGAKYVRYFQKQGFRLLYYCGTIDPATSDGGYYFATEKDTVDAVLNGKDITDFSAEANFWSKFIKVEDLRPIWPFRSARRMKRLAARLERYDKLVGISTWMWNYRKLFHGSLETWKYSRFYKRLIYQRNLLWFRYLVFMTCTALRLILKVLVVPTYFLLNLIALPFLSFYRYIGLKREKATLQRRLLVTYVWEPKKDEIVKRIASIDTEVNDRKREFYDMGRNLLALLISVIAIWVTASNLKKDATIRDLTAAKTDLSNSVTSLTADNNLQKYRVETLEAQIQALVAAEKVAPTPKETDKATR